MFVYLTDPTKQEHNKVLFRIFDTNVVVLATAVFRLHVELENTSGVSLTTTSLMRLGQINPTHCLFFHGFTDCDKASSFLANGNTLKLKRGI